VWLAGRRMNDALAGKVLIRSDFRVPSLATVNLTGRAVTAVISRGKHLLTRIEGGTTLHTHFRMDGTWHLYPLGAEWFGGPDFQVRVVLANADKVAVGYRLPVVELVPTSEELTVIGHLGPDLLDEDTDEGEAVRRLRTQPDREIGPAFLDQRNLAGIGNLYKAETLFLHGHTPWVPVVAIPDLAAVVRTARKLLRQNRNHSAQTTTGSLRRGEQHWVFERGGRPCRRCGTPVAVALQGVAPQQRISYWCPSCQTGPAPAVRSGPRRGRGSDTSRT
jgi:endonuclease-8